MNFAKVSTPAKILHEFCKGLINFKEGSMGATIVEDDNAIISVDDLIYQIGVLNVKLIEKDRLIQSTFQRLQELEKQNAELKNELSVLSNYKNDYNALAKKFNDLQEELKRKETELVKSQQIIAQKDNEIISLKAKIEVLEGGRKK